MRDTRFIFVEGIMGAGKSTTAWFLTEQIRRHGMAARFMLEGPTIDEPNHPELAICNEGNWAAYYDEMLAFLQLPSAPSEGTS